MKALMSIRQLAGRYGRALVLAVLACCVLPGAVMAQDQAQSQTQTQTQTQTQASSCDGGFQAPPFFDVARAPAAATLKKRLQIGNMIFQKGFPVIVLDTRADQACVIFPGLDGPRQGWIASKALVMDTRPFSAETWRGHWRAGGQSAPEAGLDKVVPQWALEMAPPTNGSAGDIFVYSPADFAGAARSPTEAEIFAAHPYDPGNYPVTDQTVGVAGRKVFAGRGGVVQSDSWVALTEARGGLLVYDSTRTGEAGADACLIVMLHTADDYMWVISYGTCGGDRVHDDGYYKRVP